MRHPGNILLPPALQAQVEKFIEGNTQDQNVAMIRAIEHAERNINRRLERIMRTLEDVLEVVTAQRTKITSLTALLSGIKKQLDAALGGQLTPSQQMRVDRIFNELQSNDAAIVEAIDANDGEDEDGGPKEDDLVQTKTEVTSSNLNSSVGEGVTFSASVTKMGPSENVLTGTVVFLIDGDAVTSAALDSTGVAAISSADLAGALKEGDHEVKAKFTGAGKFAPSESDTIKQVVSVPEGNPGGTTFGDIKERAARQQEDKRVGRVGGDPSLVGMDNSDPAKGPTAEWPGDPNNHGRPTTQTRPTRPGLPDTPGVPNTGVSGLGGNANEPGTPTNAPGDHPRDTGVGDTGQFSQTDLDNATRPIGSDQNGDAANGQRGGTGLNAGSAVLGNAPSDATRDQGAVAGGLMNPDGTTVTGDARTISPTVTTDPAKVGERPQDQTGVDNRLTPAPNPAPGTPKEARVSSVGGSADN